MAINSVVEESEGELIIEGYAIVFDTLDSYGTIFKKGCCEKTLQENKDRIALCYQHDIFNPIAKIEEIKEDEKGLWIRARISDSEDDIKIKIREGILKELSIGFESIKVSYDSFSEIITILEIKLYEVSIVTIASNPNTIIESIRSEDRVDYLMNQMDKILAIEQNRNKKFELLKLRSLIECMPIQSHTSHEPKEVFMTEKPKLNINKLNLL